jgi:hypothetical protein
MYSTRSEEYMEALNDGSSLYTSGCFLNPQKFFSSLDKIDLVVWSNNTNTLDVVLKRINKVIPKEVVNHKFLVNDHSEDHTPIVASWNGWTHVICKGHGISDAANCALDLVETKWFASFENDLLLSPYWWNKVSQFINKPNVVAISGTRFLPKENFCHSIEYYNSINQVGYGKTLDNTLWNTKVLRSLGGFPKLKHAGLDTYLSEKIKANGYEWLVDGDVQSIHLHKGLYSELKRYYFYGSSLPELYSKIDSFCQTYRNENSKSFVVKLLKSPVSSLKMSLEMKDGRLMLSYPLVRLFWLLGYLRGKNFD